MQWHELVCGQVSQRCYFGNYKHIQLLMYYLVIALTCAYETVYQHKPFTKFPDVSCGPYGFGIRKINK